jgi:hypothetical protein
VDKKLRQAHEWSYSSHQESIGKTLSSPDTRSNKKTHANCGLSVRMAGIMDVNEDQIPRQGRGNNKSLNYLYLTSLSR